MSENKLVCVGKVLSAHGIKGEVKIKHFTESPESFAQYVVLYSADGKKSYSVKIRSMGSKGIIARVDGVSTRDEAEKLKGTELFIYKDMLPELGDDEFYYEDLISLKVIDENGEDVGVVSAIYNHGANDIIEIMLKKSGQAMLLPFTKVTVPEVDVAKGFVVVSFPDVEELDIESDEEEDGELFFIGEADNDNRK